MKTQHVTSALERAFLVGVTWKRARRIPGVPAGEQGRESLAELVELARSAGAEVAAPCTRYASLPTPPHSWVVGS